MTAPVAAIPSEVVSPMAAVSSMVVVPSTMAVLPILTALLVAVALPSLFVATGSVALAMVLELSCLSHLAVSVPSFSGCPPISYGYILLIPILALTAPTVTRIAVAEAFRRCWWLPVTLPFWSLFSSGATLGMHPVC